MTEEKTPHQVSFFHTEMLAFFGLRWFCRRADLPRSRGTAGQPPLLFRLKKEHA